MSEQNITLSGKIEAMQRRMLSGTASARRKAYLAAASKPYASGPKHVEADDRRDDKSEGSDGAEES